MSPVHAYARIFVCVITEIRTVVNRHKYQAGLNIDPVAYRHASKCQV